jgi:hypothetical protein
VTAIIVTAIICFTILFAVVWIDPTVDLRRRR